VADVGLEAAVLAAGAQRHLLPAHARVAGRPRLVGELGERDGLAVTARRRMAGREDEADGVVQEVVAAQPGRDAPRPVAPFVADDEIDVAERERGQRVLGLGLDELAAKPRRVAGQRLHRRQRDAQRDRLEAGDPRAPGHRARGRGEVRLGPRGALEQRARMCDEDERRVGQAHAAP
jgi:hypothetical protein